MHSATTNNTANNLIIQEWTIWNGNCERAVNDVENLQEIVVVAIQLDVMPHVKGDLRMKVCLFRSSRRLSASFKLDYRDVRVPESFWCLYYIFRRYYRRIFLSGMESFFFSSLTSYYSHFTAIVPPQLSHLAQYLVRAVRKTIWLRLISFTMYLLVTSDSSHSLGTVSIQIAKNFSPLRIHTEQHSGVCKMLKENCSRRHQCRLFHTNARCDAAQWMEISADLMSNLLGCVVWPWHDERARWWSKKKTMFGARIQFQKLKTCNNFWLYWLVGSVQLMSLGDRKVYSPIE